MKDEILLADLKLECTRNVPGMSVPGMSVTREASKKMHQNTSLITGRLEN